MSSEPSGLARLPQARCIVEVLGPSGAGKTTIVRTLEERGAVRDQFLASWPVKLCFLGSITAEFLPAYLRECPGGRWFNREELRRMLYIKEWPPTLAQQPSGGKITVIDHGPLCMLGMIQGFGPKFVSGRFFARWSKAALAEWSNVLNVVLWLDAPNTTLIQRINLRENGHIIKGKPIREAAAFLERCRLEYDKILSELTTGGHTKVLRFDTSAAPPELIVEQFLRALAAHADVREVRNECEGFAARCS